MKKYTHTHGFTILELLMVIFMITLILGIVLVSFSRAKKNVSDDQKLAQLDLVRLALEQYRAQCKVYPNTFALTADNAYPGTQSTCSVTLGDFIVPDTDVTLFSYQALGATGIGSGYCSAYHIAVQLEERVPNQGKLARDDDWTVSGNQGPCSGASAISSDDATGWYDIKHP